MRRAWVSAAVVLPLLAVGGAGAQQPGGWVVYGNDLERTSSTATDLSPPSLRPAWYTPVSGRISSQALVAENVPSPGVRTVYVATTAGVVYALAENGYIRWRVEFGQLDRFCSQIDGYGVTGTPAIDPQTSTIYLVDAFGRLHALDLVTGAERPGWPLRLYTDHRREHVWGALTLVNGSIYLGTGAYCDRPMVAKIFRVELATRRVSRWQVVPPKLGGGGGVWGWGGIAYSPRRGSLFLATGNAFRRGSNVGRRFRESAGYGEHLVELSLDLKVRSASHPRNIRAPIDLDFVGSPVVFPHVPCGDLVGVLNKNGFLYVWRTARVRAGPLFSLRLARRTIVDPLLSQPAYSPRTGGIYVATPRHLMRVDVDRRCRGRVAWKRKVGNGLFNASPTIAGNTVWVAENANRGSRLLGFDARSGGTVYRGVLAGATYVAPTVFGERLYIGTYTGGVQGFALSSALQRPAGTSQSILPEHRSFPDTQHGWISREDGVFSTEDGGRTWRLVYPRSAASLVRTSATAGIITTGDQASPCGCRVVRLWTADGGATWRRTGAAAGAGFLGAAGTLWWWRAGSLFRAQAWPPVSGLRGRRVVKVSGVIVDAKPVPAGVLALASNRIAGIGFDRSPRLVLVQGEGVQLMRLPRVGGEVLVRSLTASWPSATVTASDVTAFTRGEQGVVTWSTSDGGRSWRVARS